MLVKCECDKDKKSSRPNYSHLCPANRI